MPNNRRTRGLILHTLPSFTFIYRSYLSDFREFDRFLGNEYHSCGILESCGDPDPSVGRRSETAPQQLFWGTRCHAWVC